MRLARLAYEEPGDVPSINGENLHVFFELGDHLGSTSVVLDKATGELVERSTYQAYGGSESDYRPERWKHFREDYRFTGKEEDVEVGLIYFGKRFLNPLLNRWVSADPLAVHGLGADPNLYAYVSGRVLQSVDPLGLEPLSPDDQMEVNIAFAHNRADIEFPALHIHAEPPPGTYGMEEGGLRWDAQQEAEWDAGFDGTVAGLVDTVEELAGGAPLSLAKKAGLVQEHVLPTPDRPSDPVLASHYDFGSNGAKFEANALIALTAPLVLEWGVSRLSGGYVPSYQPELEAFGVAGANEGTVARTGLKAKDFVTPPEPGQISYGYPENGYVQGIEGHGSELPGTFQLPKGTWLELPNTPASGELKGDVAVDAILRGTCGPGKGRLYQPGDAVPRLVLESPSVYPQFDALPGSITVDAPTLLEDILIPNMGYCLWGACRKPIVP